MGYCAATDYIRYIRSLSAVDETNEDSDQRFVDQIYLMANLDAASARVDSYLAMRYTIPLVKPSTELKRAVCAVCRWNIELLGEVRQSVQAHYEDAIGWLEKIASGELALIDADGIPVPPSGSGIDPDMANRLNGAMFTGDRSTSTYVPQFRPDYQNPYLNPNPRTNPLLRRRAYRG